MRRALITTMLVAAAICGAGGTMEAGSAAPGRDTWAGAALEGQPVDLAPWAYLWRADRAVQKQPEACFIPRRLERIDRLYRTAADVLPPDQLKSIYYDLQDLLKRLPPKPRGHLLTGLLWTGGLNDARIELRWPPRGRVPAPETVEVRTYPTSFGWFGWTVDRVLTRAEVSPDGRTWVYRTDPFERMDSAYNVRVPAATEMVAVFAEIGPNGERAPVPALRITSPELGAWKRMEVEIEWGFRPGDDGRALDGRLEPSVAQIGPARPLSGDATTVMTGPARWRSAPGSSPRRGIVATVLYAPDARPGLDSRVTIWTRPEGVTFRIKDLETGPILLPRHGLFIARAGEGATARVHAAELAARASKSMRQMTREHREPGSFEDLMQEVRLWTCAEGTKLTPFPPVPDPPMQVSLSDPWWTAAWRAASHQLTGAHMWGGLAFEVARVTHAMELVGLRQHAEPVYDHFLKGPGAKPDGDYSDGAGALEWATSLRHDMGYSHDGTHASTGRLLYSMAQRYFLTGDAGWFAQRRARLQAAADWIVRQRRDYLKHVPNRERLHVAGLMPPCMLGDYAIPSCDWHWYYVDNALALQGLRRFAEALVRFDPPAGRRYLREAEDFQRDLRRAFEREAALSPVRRGWDGVYRSFVPRMAYARGLTGLELGAPQFPDCDLWMGSLPLAEPGAGVEASDPRMVDTLDAMEEMGASPAVVTARADERRRRGRSADDAWYWHTSSILPKASHVANAYLLQDDVPGFLRFWMTHYAITVGADGKLWEHAHPGNFEPCAAPDNGTAGWFLECFRNLLVMEEGSTLWVARGTPRAWLEQGKRIAVASAPTCFGPLAYEIVSDADHGAIRATVEVPSREPAREIALRLRHPHATPLRSVTVNGRAWTRFDPASETIRLPGAPGKREIVARY